jgi:hypothetical protein
MQLVTAPHGREVGVRRGAGQIVNALGVTFRNFRLPGQQQAAKLTYHSIVRIIGRT